MLFSHCILCVLAMPRQRKRGVGARGAAAGAGGTRRAVHGAGAAGSENSPDGKQHCGSCAGEVLDGCIGCDRCETWVHGTEMCAGLPTRVIEAILEHDGQGISYFCLKCRVTQAAELEKSSSQPKEDLSSGTLTQIFQQIQGLCSAVAALTAQVEALTSCPRPSASDALAPQQLSEGHNTNSRNTNSSGTYAAALTRQPNPNTSNPDQTLQTAEYRQIVRQELRELHEREKRKDSVVVHGLKSTSIRGVSTEFKELTRNMMGTQVELTDITPIAGHPGLYRGKILSENDRKLVLDKAKTLKGTDYDRVYIRKDLTYNQRCALKARRDAFRTGQAPPRDSGVNHESAQESVVPRPQGGTLINAGDVTPRCEPVPGALGGSDGHTSDSRKLTTAASSTGAPEHPVGPPKVNSNPNPEPPQSN